MVEFKADNIRYEIRFKKHSDDGKDLGEYSNFWKYTGYYDKHSYSKTLAIAKMLKEDPNNYEVTLVTITEERERV